jgi:hypothetical protein
LDVQPLPDNNGELYWNENFHCHPENNRYVQ